MAKDNVVFAILGSSLDQGYAQQRWERWRPTPALLGHPDTLPITRIELMYTSGDHSNLLDRVTKDLHAQSPGLEVVHRFLDLDDPWDFPAVYAALFDLFRDYPFNTAKNDYFLQMATGTHVAKICLFLLAEARIAPARLLSTRPFTADERGLGDAWRGKLHLVDLSRERYDAIASRFEHMAATHSDLLRNGIRTLNPAFNEMIEEVEQVATRSSAPMLITGPTGAGKSQLASRIFELRTKNGLIGGAFVEINCATLRGDNALSALFGHKKGAFTGAVNDRNGFLREADGGIAFLDEIGELGLEEQAMLLKALEEKKFTPLGADKPVSSDFQLLAGTNKDLALEVAAGLFRADLLARINVWTFRLPGLSERKEDIEPNLDYELKRQSKLLNKLVSFNADARARYLAYAMSAPWPGNFRDLSASMQRMATLAEGGRITLKEVQRELARLGMATGVVPNAAPAPSTHAVGHLAPLVLSSDELNSLTLLKRMELEYVLSHVAASSSVADLARRLLLAQGDDGAHVNFSHKGKLLLARFGLHFPLVKERLAQARGLTSN